MPAVRRILAFTAPALVMAALAVVVLAGEGRVDLRAVGGDPEGCGVERQPASGALSATARVDPRYRPLSRVTARLNGRQRGLTRPADCH
jgi:hypothetical protein